MAEPDRRQALTCLRSGNPVPVLQMIECADTLFATLAVAGKGRQVVINDWIARVRRQPGYAEAMIRYLVMVAIEGGLTEDDIAATRNELARAAARWRTRHLGASGVGDTLF